MSENFWFNVLALNLDRQFIGICKLEMDMYFPGHNQWPGALGGYIDFLRPEPFPFHCVDLAILDYHSVQPDPIYEIVQQMRLPNKHRSSVRVVVITYGSGQERGLVDDLITILEPTPEFVIKAIKFPMIPLDFLKVIAQQLGTELIRKLSVPAATNTQETI